MARKKTPETDSRRGRPKSSAKRAGIIEAAKGLFLREGLEGASMDGIAEAAGVSKMTVYAHFGDKESLFREVIAAEARRVFDAPLSLGKEGGSFRARLECMGVALLELLSRPQVQELHRLMCSQAGRHDRMARLFYEAGPGAMHQLVQRMIAEEVAAGNLHVPDPALAADQLLSMWKGMQHLRQELGLAGPLPKAEMERHVRAAVQVFLRGYGGACPG